MISSSKKAACHTRAMPGRSDSWAKRSVGLVRSEWSDLGGIEAIVGDRCVWVGIELRAVHTVVGLGK